MCFDQNMHELGCSSKKHKHKIFKTRSFVQLKQLRFLPNLFTLGNAFFGFTSIIYSTSSDFSVAAYFILLGALLDSLDGRVARFLGTSNSFGMHLDSLCDTVSFCLAPAILVYSWKLHRFGFVGLLVCAAFFMTGVLRLAKFNLTSEKQTTFFVGMPTTIAGCLIATVVLNSIDGSLKLAHSLPLLGLTLLLSFLMVSNVPFPAFKQLKKKRATFMIFVCLAFIISMGLLKVLLVFFALYLVLSVAYFFKLKVSAALARKRHKKFLSNSESDVFA
jgi:CDP-diacylglycerol---serine O-phosphatidyltransferase